MHAALRTRAATSTSSRLRGCKTRLCVPCRVGLAPAAHSLLALLPSRACCAAFKPRLPCPLPPPSTRGARRDHVRPCSLPFMPPLPAARSRGTQSPRTHAHTQPPIHRWVGLQSLLPLHPAPDSHLAATLRPGPATSSETALARTTARHCAPCGTSTEAAPTWGAKPTPTERRAGNRASSPSAAAATTAAE